MVVVSIDVMMMMVIVRISFGGEPFFDIGNLFVGIVEAAAEDAIGCRLAFGGVENGRCRIEYAQPPHDAVALRDICEIGFSQHNAIGDSRLLDGFGMRVERSLAVDRV